MTVLCESACVALNIILALFKSSRGSDVSSVKDLVAGFNVNMLMDKPVLVCSLREIVRGHSAYRWVKDPCFVTGP